MSIIDTATAHFAAQETRSKVVPEWGATIYAKPLNMAQKGQWLARAKGSNTDYMVYAVLFGSLDKAGKPIFTLDDLDTLKYKVDADVLSEVATFVLGADAVTEEEREKN